MTKFGIYISENKEELAPKNKRKKKIETFFFLKQKQEKTLEDALVCIKFILYGWNVIFSRHLREEADKEAKTRIPVVWCNSVQKIRIEPSNSCPINS